MPSLTKLHESEDTVLTAHRGASFADAENTLAAFETAVQCGADVIEFDLYVSNDGIPVVSHDYTIDRTSDGHGEIEKMSLAELRKYNYSWFSGGKRLEAPLYPELTIPTFEDVLKQFRDRACMNIQVYAKPDGLREICRLYLDYGMEEHGYLTIASMETAELVRKYSAGIEICLTPGWNERALPENLEKCAKFGCRFVQPTAESVTEETFALCRKLGLRDNIFFADSQEKADQLTSLGASGIMTNRIGEMKHRKRRSF